MDAQLDVLQTYFDLVQSLNPDPAAYAAVLHPEVVQTEYPNSLNRSIQRRSFSEIIDNLRLGRELLRDPSFEVQRTTSCTDGSIVVEGVWQATVVSDMRGLLRGQRLASHLCLIFEFKDGKIYRQRRYPCFEQV